MPELKTCTLCGVAEHRSRVVVVPDRHEPVTARSAQSAHMMEGWNACLDELARLNGKTASAETLRRIDLVLAALRSHDLHGTIASTIGDNWRDEVDGMRGELRDLIVEGKEVGDE